MTTNTIDLSAGTIDYEDSGGDGPVVVLLHGLLMDHTLWSDVVQNFGGAYRCIVPTLPLGAHRHPVTDTADLSLGGLAGLVAEFLDRLSLQDVTLVGNDTGGALVQMVILKGNPRVSRIVLASCEAFDNFPPGATGKTLFLTGKLPPALFGAFMQQLRLKPLRRMPISFGWLTKRGDRTVAKWLEPVLTQPEIRRDAVRLLRALAPGRSLLIEASEGITAFPGPGLVVWAQGDRVMPPKHGARLAELLPQGRLVEVPDSYTLIPLDQPAQLAAAIDEFVSTASTRP
ncbi:MAG TPA: alpha/beta hydrolase [Kribbella sp.]|uniref:alpha/beta fold hydrolase n=1 Tax=Kribbella sp. TaxID=1871183 RepID=UPI002D7906CE|nr:alpha/beta hydrolase [Kribbella sp.]HET6298508.1 alpha/beta hydrolase [Kribbella sp.]